jgi:hypothetical protein
MTFENWGTTLGALGMFAIAVGGIVWSHGHSANRLDNAEGDIKGLSDRIKELEALKGAVDGLSVTVGHMTELLRGEITRVAESMAAAEKLAEERLRGMATLFDREVDEIKENTRAIRASLDARADRSPAPRNRAKSP